MNIGFIGYGNVGGALIKNLSQLDHKIKIGLKELSPEASLKVANLGAKNVEAVPLNEITKAIDILFVATPFLATADILKSLGGLEGMTIVDCTNPVGPGMTHGLRSETSGTEFLQNEIKEAHFVKAFTIYGFENFENNKYPYAEVKPAMLIAGNNPEAKVKTSFLVEQLGWQPVDTGDASMALHLEHMTLLWIKMGRIQGIGSDFTWAMLTR